MSEYMQFFYQNDIRFAGSGAKNVLKKEGLRLGSMPEALGHLATEITDRMTATTARATTIWATVS
jgi:hypothetical protein